MALSEQTESIEQRLSQQMRWFSQLSETLTLRLLELEERVHNLEKTNKLIKSDSEDETQQLLSDSQEKVQHLQTLLQKPVRNISSMVMPLDWPPPAKKQPRLPDREESSISMKEKCT